MAISSARQGNLFAISVVQGTSDDKDFLLNTLSVSASLSDRLLVLPVALESV
jgi:hypothetical protein